MITPKGPSQQATRNKFRNKRNNLSNQQQESASIGFVHQCRSLDNFEQTKYIACYLANDGEINLQPLIEYCWAADIQVCLPVLHPFSAGHLLFIKYTVHSAMVLNRYQIAEPVMRCDHIIPLEQIAIIITPLVAFDRLGRRLGMGGGFYDRTLAPIRRDQLATTVFGAAHECQLEEAGLNANPWDIPMQKIITPEQIYIAP